MIVHLVGDRNRLMPIFCSVGVFDVSGFRLFVPEVHADGSDQFTDIHG